MGSEDIDHITEQLQADDDVIIVKEFLHGAKEALMMSNDNVRRMLTNIQVKSFLYIPLKVAILTPYKLTIPIGIIVLSTKRAGSVKVKINKFYVSKIWRATGYEERAIMEMLKFCFAKIEECSKVLVSFYSQNVYFIKLLMGIGFRFNKQNKDNGDPK